jgi:hypothetical protein
VVAGGGAGGFRPRIADVIRDGLPRTVVAALAYAPSEFGHRGDRRVVADGRCLRDRVDVDGEHARASRQHRLGDVL